jgi:hypothetical protein
MQPLNPRQARFVEEYLIDLSATKAAERAGYSAKSAKSLGSRLLSRPAVAAAIHEARIRRSSLVEVRQEEVLRELQLIAYRETERTGDRVRALELLGRHLGMFTDRLEMTTSKVRLEDLVPRPKPRPLPMIELGTADHAPAANSDPAASSDATREQGAATLEQA